MAQKIQTSIPTTKVSRAMRITRTGLSIGKNYVKHYAKKLTTADKKTSLQEDNASDIYDTLSELKGSALKIAQMMSMDQNILPEPYANKFQQAQYSAPPLSYPLVIRTFKKYLKKSPFELFETFSRESMHAASIGQVHLATVKGKKLAVEIQYPGVAESIESDINMVRPLAIRFLGLNKEMVNDYSIEVKDMLLQETDYLQELKQGQTIAELCKDFKGLQFPKYYPEFSAKHILTMEWLEGKHLKQFIDENPSQEIRNQIGQILWDFFDYQMHVLKQVHADPHPGNFLFHDDEKVGVIDFGCVKKISPQLYEDYFALIDISVISDKQKIMPLLFKLNYLHKDDNSELQKILYDAFITVTSILSEPFQNSTFDFGNEEYFRKIYESSQKLSEIKELRNSKKHRGYRESLYLNRTYFGLYSLLGELKANIRTAKQM